MVHLKIAEIDKDWPLHGLESVIACPYCGAVGKSMAYRDVRDWSFGCAAGGWSYWACDGCRALYLDPRPTPDTLSNAYGTQKTAFDALDGTDRAAKAESRRQEAISAMGDAAERYLKLHTASRLL